LPLDLALFSLPLAEASTWEEGLTPEDVTGNLFKTKLVQRGNNGLWEMPVNNILFGHKGLLDAAALQLAAADAKWSEASDMHTSLFLMINNKHRWTVNGMPIYIGYH
jgi:hypothetical protein